MHDLLLDVRLHVDMAGETEVRFDFYEQVRVLRLMRIMARGAVPRGRGAMDELEVDLIGMAFRAELLGRLGKELRLRRVVRIMAGRAHAVLDGRMNVSHGPKRRMALIAQRGRLIRELKGLYLFLGVRSADRLVAGIAGFRRRMDIFGFEHVRVAFRGHAAIGCNGSSGHRGKTNRKKDR